MVIMLLKLDKGVDYFGYLWKTDTLLSLVNFFSFFCFEGPSETGQVQQTLWQSMS